MAGKIQRKKSSEKKFHEQLDKTVVEDILKKKPEKAKKSGKEKPIIHLPDTVKLIFTNFVQKRKEIKETTDKMQKEEEQIIKHCQKVFDKNSLEKEFEKTYHITNGVDTASFSAVDSFSFSNDSEKQKEIKKVLGIKNFNENTEEISVTFLKPEVFSDTDEGKKLRKELMSLLGDNFEKFFETKKTLKLKKGFSERMYQIAKESDEPKTKLEEIKKVMVQSKPHVKVL